MKTDYPVAVRLSSNTTIAISNPGRQTKKGHAVLGTLVNKPGRYNGK